MPAGRPSKYSDKLAARICERLAEGRSLREICGSDDMPPESTVRQWVVDDREGFSAQYARAREAQADLMAEEILDIADNASNDWMERNGDDNEGWQVNGEHIQRSRLRVDSRKWLMSKLKPKKYGDKVQHSGDPDNPVQIIVGTGFSSGWGSGGGEA